MHNLKKIRFFRIILTITYPFALIFIYPFCLLKRKSHSSLFFFFDRYALGGAQQVYLDILQSADDFYKEVYFTRKSANNVFRDNFYSLPHTRCRDIHIWCDFLLFRIFSVHYYALYINRHQRAHVFSSNSTFFFDMLPYIKKKITRTELLHNFTYGKKGFEFFGLANYKYLDNRIVVDDFTASNIEQQYKEYHIPQHFFDRVKLIEPGVFIPAELNKNFLQPLRVVYAGRGGPQKRIWLINEIAEYFIDQRLPATFHFAGPMTGELSDAVKQNAFIHGNISDRDEMNKLYLECHVILMTSAYEGFPMLIKEGMAFGCIPLVTALPGNKMHLKDEANSLLIENSTEQEIVAAGIAKLKQLLDDSSLLQDLSSNAYRYAREHFTRSRFVEQYRKLLLPPKI